MHPMFLADPTPLTAGAPIDSVAKPGADSTPPSRLSIWTARALAASWSSGLTVRPTLDPDALVVQAVRAERLDDFGPDHWREPFRVLAESLADEAQLNPVGLMLAHGQLLKALRGRLRAHELWRRRPEVLERPIPAPVVVLGSMRSGTTRVQRLLACDRRLSHTRLFEALSPVPDRGPDRRALRTDAGLRFLRALNPRVAAVHPTRARAPDEEFGLFAYSFSGAHYLAQWHVPRFQRWWEGRDARAVHAEFRRLLQTVAWSRGGPDGRPWVLKAPQFMEELDALLAAFPDARLLCLSRDAEAVVASSCSLVWQQRRVQSDRACRRTVGRQWLAKTGSRVRAAAAVRAKRPDVPQLRLDYRATDRDWRGEMARAYDFLGLPFAPAAEAAMARYQARATGHRSHRYRLEEFGLTAGEVRRELPDGA